MDAPYKEGGNRLIDENLKRYLWTGLDYERYEVIKIIPQMLTSHFFPTHTLLLAKTKGFKVFC